MAEAVHVPFIVQMDGKAVLALNQRCDLVVAELWEKGYALTKRSRTINCDNKGEVLNAKEVMQFELKRGGNG